MVLIDLLYKLWQWLYRRWCLYRGWCWLTCSIDRDTDCIEGCVSTMGDSDWPASIAGRVIEILNRGWSLFREWYGLTCFTSGYSVYTGGGGECRGWCWLTCLTSGQCACMKGGVCLESGVRVEISCDWHASLAGSALVRRMVFVKKTLFVWRVMLTDLLHQLLKWMYRGWCLYRGPFGLETLVIFLCIEVYRVVQTDHLY